MGRDRGVQEVEDDKETSDDVQWRQRESEVDIVLGKPTADATSILITNSLTCLAPFPLCRHTHPHMHSLLPVLSLLYVS